MSDDVFIRAYPPARPAPGPAVWLLFQGGELLVKEEGGNIRLLTTENLPADWPQKTALFLGTLHGLPCLADEVAAEATLPTGWQAISLRALFGQVSEAEYSLAGYTAQMLYWRRTNRYCPVCGHETQARDNDWGRICPHCGHVGYPRISPAVLILVHDGARLLLAHKPGWGPRYSILAGFVEPGESLEECVHREVMEEVGMLVSDLDYVGSQAWPYPHQLMVGFTARYAGGDIRVDAAELDDARWFTRKDLPDLPSSVSLSRRMIDSWLADHV